MALKLKPPSMKGPAAWFTGEVWINPITLGDALSKLAVSAVRIMPGARTAWHSHSTGQTLYVTDGDGLVQPRSGDIVSIAPATSSCTGREVAFGTARATTS